MGEIMNSPKGVKSGVPERVSISCPHMAPVTIDTKYPILYLKALILMSHTTACHHLGDDHTISPNASLHIWIQE